MALRQEFPEDDTILVLLAQQYVGRHHILAIVHGQSSRVVEVRYSGGIIPAVVKMDIEQRLQPLRVEYTRANPDGSIL